MDEGIVIYHGYLKKSPPEHRLMRTWQRRYFVLRSNKKLFYFKNEKDKKPVKDPIDLGACRCVEAKLHHQRYPYVFSVNTSARTYYLVADTQADMDTWVEKICFVCGFEKQDDPSSPESTSSPSASSALSATSQSPSKSQTVPNVYTSSTPRATCPLSEETQGRERSHSDPDSQENIRRATNQYQVGLERRRSTQCTRENLRLPLKQRPEPAGLCRVVEGYDPLPHPVPSEGRRSFYDDVPTPSPVSPQSRGSTLRSPADNYDVVTPNRRSQEVNYDIVPTPRRTSENYDIVPSPRGAFTESDDIYDIPPITENMNSPQQDEIYDIVPRREKSECEAPHEHYNVVPPPRPAPPGSAYPPRPSSTVPPLRPSSGVPPSRPSKTTKQLELYDIVPPPRPTSSDLYDIVPRGFPVSDEIYDVPPTAAEIRQGTQSSNPPQDLYDDVPAPRPSRSPDATHKLNSSMSSQCSLSDSFERDSGSFTDDIYDVPPRPDVDVYDTVPLREDDIYDVPPPGLTLQDQEAPPLIDRSRKPPTVDKVTKPSGDATSPPAVNRSLKPSRDNTHSYVNLLPAQKRLMMTKSQSLPDNYDHVTPSRTQARQMSEDLYTSMQPCRSESTRCYSFSKDHGAQVDDNNSYEDMQPITESGVPKRESGVHSNSSSEDDDEDSHYTYMTSPQDIVARGNRRAALQYCEVQIVEGSPRHLQGQAAHQRDSASHYTTINEESTKAFLETCNARKECLQENS